MNSLLRNLGAFILAILVAYIASTLIIICGHYIIPPPIEIDTNDFESIKSNFHLYKDKHFIFPLIAHVLGTFLAGYCICRFSTDKRMIRIFLLGGLFMLLSLSLIWKLDQFNIWAILELSLYIPMSLSGYYLWKGTAKKH